MNPSISVVIPTFNSAQYLGRAIRSALAQTVQPLEIIVVDDGSTDNTADIVATYRDAVRLYCQPNGGAAAARNTGIRAARGSHIAFLDSDDYWLSTKLECQIQVLRRFPTVPLVSTLWRWLPFGSDPAQADFQGPAPDPHAIEIKPGWRTLLPDPYLGTPTVLVATDAAREIGGFDTTLPSSEDVDFFLRICGGETYALVRQPLIAAQLRSGSLTQTERGAHYNLLVLDRLAKTHPEMALEHAALLDSCRLAIYNRWIRGLIVRGEGASARAKLRESRAVGALRRRHLLYLKTFTAPAVRWLRTVASSAT